MSQFNLRQIQELQAKLVKAQEELEHTNVEVTAGGGAIKIVINGHQKFQSITIAPRLSTRRTRISCRTSFWQPAMRPSRNPRSWRRSTWASLRAESKYPA